MRDDEGKSKRLACVIGTGRSGTEFLSRTLRNHGHELGHEELRRDGIVSWCLTADHEKTPYGPSWRDLDKSEFVIGHQMRHPLKTIPSLSTINKKSWNFIAESGIGDVRSHRTMLSKSMEHWLSWNQVAFHKADFHWTLSNMKMGVLPFLEELGWELETEAWEDSFKKENAPINSAKQRVLNPKTILKTSPQVLYRRIQHAYFPQKLDWRDLEKTDQTLTLEIKDFWNAALPTHRTKSADHGILHSN